MSHIYDISYRNVGKNPIENVSSNSSSAICHNCDRCMGYTMPQLRGHIFCQDSPDLDCRTIFRNLEAEPGLLDRAEVGGEGDKLSDSDGD